MAKVELERNQGILSRLRRFYNLQLPETQRFVPNGRSTPVMVRLLECSLTKSYDEILICPTP
jgi:hypothetical protein